jgi:tetratricopeptide (TPR) repeat protein
MPKSSAGSESAEGRGPSFEKLLIQDQDLSALRAEYARRPPAKRRSAAEWAYDEAIADSMFTAALARVAPDGGHQAGWPPGFAALAIDPEYAPALLTVGCYEYGSGRKRQGMGLFLELTELSPQTPDWVEIVDKAGSFLVNFGAHDDACRLYQAALKVQPDQLEFITGLGWALCRAGQQAEALPWLKKAVAKAPDESSVLSDYGWALAELGRFEQAEPALEKAVQLAPPGDELPANNLARMRWLRQQSDHKTE